MKKKLNQNKPLRLVHMISSLKIGGAEAMLVDLVDYLRNKEFDQHVVYFYEGPHLQYIQKRGIPTYQIKGLLCLYDPLFFIRLFLLIRKLKPDCLHTLLWAANFSGCLIARIVRIPIVTALHNNIDQNGRVRIYLDRFVIGKASMIVAVSEGVKKSLLSFFPARHLPSIKVITNGIDAAKVRKQGWQFNKKRSELEYSDEHFVIGSVGRFVSIKNYSLLIEQLPLLLYDYSHVRVIVIGTGHQEKYLKKKIKELKLEHYVNIIVNKKALGYYPLFDCFVQPSYKEGVSMALLEAMSFGLPCVVGSHVPEHAVITSGLNGLIVTPGQSFSQALRLLIQQPKLRYSIGMKAQITVQSDFSLTTMAVAYENFFTELSNSV